MSNDELRKVVEIPEGEGAYKGLTPSQMIAIPTPPQSQLPPQPALSQPQQGQAQAPADSQGEAEMPHDSQEAQPQNLVASTPLQEGATPAQMMAVPKPPQTEQPQQAQPTASPAPTATPQAQDQAQRQE